MRNRYPSNNGSGRPFAPSPRIAKSAPARGWLARSASGTSATELVT
jgi:hypothetical protein